MAPGGATAAGVQRPRVPTEKLADGVYLILGGYAAVASTSRTTSSSSRARRARRARQQIIDAAKRLIPGKPIRYVVNTHHHFDHSSGLRTFVAEGATVVTHEVNKAYFEKLFALPHTLAPDRLQQAKRAPKFETVTDKKVMTDGNQRDRAAPFAAAADTTRG